MNNNNNTTNNNKNIQILSELRCINISDYFAQFLFFYTINAPKYQNVQITEKTPRGFIILQMCTDNSC